MDKQQKKPTTPPTPQQMAATAGRAIDKAIARQKEIAKKAEQKKSTTPPLPEKTGAVMGEHSTKQ